MALAAGAGIAARPSTKGANGEPRYVLKDLIPARFGAWREVQQGAVQVINPQMKQLIDKLYSQTLTRTYENPSGYRIMLSMAYGDDQRGELQAHKPEVCYPSQGFTVTRDTQGPLVTPFGRIPVRRLDTQMGQRFEPVTYWFTVGDTPVRTRWEQRLVQIRLGLTGEIPDGLLFRVSSIDESSARAYELQRAFVSDLLANVSALDRFRLSGLRSAAS
jgi:EpsI family protein